MVTKVFSWTIGLVSGLIQAGIRSVAAGHERHMIARPIGRRHRSRRWLCEAVIGRSMSSVVELLGPPPTTTAPVQETWASADRATYWQADVWYYPWNRREESAVAIHFERGVATRVEFLQSP